MCGATPSSSGPEYTIAPFLTQPEVFEPFSSISSTWSIAQLGAARKASTNGLFTFLLSTSNPTTNSISSTV